tara:strand:- start:577 stop:1119 length:543 start_codon:yes stop_codon:yes gene_type:complete
MHRAPLLKLVQSYSERHPREDKTVSRYRKFIANNTDCFERTLLKGHITCAAWIIDLTNTKALLTHHRKLNKWLQLGGHADGDSNVHRVAAREAREESGIGSLRLLSKEILDIDIHKIPERKNVPEHLHYDARFLFQVTDNETYQVSNESHDLAWVPIEEIHNYTKEESIIRMIAKAKVLI